MIPTKIAPGARKKLEDGLKISNKKFPLSYDSDKIPKDKKSKGVTTFVNTCYHI